MPERGGLLTRTLELPRRFDLARTVAPISWGRGQWPNADWRDGALYWVGWEERETVWRSAAQTGPMTLSITGSASRELDRDWAARLLGTESGAPAYLDPALNLLAVKHVGMGMWAAGSLYEGFVSSIVGQSISVAAAAIVERRLYAMFHPGVAIQSRLFWPPPRPEQLAEADCDAILDSGITRVRAAALRDVGIAFCQEGTTTSPVGTNVRSLAESMLPIRGIGRWTVESALLWGTGDPDAHPSGDVALLRAARAHYPGVATLADLDRLAAAWRPNRAWAARLLWVDLLGFPDA